VVQTVELVLDAETDGAVRRAWEVLAAAGLPSQARHTGTTNRPHVTLAVASQIPAAVEAPLVRAVSGLPMPLRLGGFVCFAGRRRVLARLVVPSAELLRLHAAVAQVVAHCPGLSSQLLPGRWTPHVTLARGLTAPQVGAALEVLADRAELVGAAVAARRYDGDRRTDWWLSS
jgi:2'-5' RNA ligase